MIVTIVNQAGPAQHGVLSESLARLRAHSGRKVLLLDTQRERRGLVRAQLHGGCAGADAGGFQRAYDDVVIEADAGDALLCRRALAAAEVVVVALAPHTETALLRRLTARLSDAQASNPAMRLLLACPAKGKACDVDPGDVARLYRAAFGQGA